jgi:hypothetical protein
MSTNSGLTYRGAKLTTNGDAEGSNDHQLHFGNADDSSESHIGAPATNYSTLQSGQKVVYQAVPTARSNNFSNKGKQCHAAIFVVFCCCTTYLTNVFFFIFSFML